MKQGFWTMTILTMLLTGCPDAPDPPVTVNRGAGIEAVSNQTVVIVTVTTSSKHTIGTSVQRALAGWLKENPRAKIIQMEVVGRNGSAGEIVLLVEGELGTK